MQPVCMFKYAYGHATAFKPLTQYLTIKKNVLIIYRPIE